MKQTRSLSVIIALLFLILIPVISAGFLLAGIYYCGDRADMIMLGLNTTPLMFTSFGIAGLILIALPVLLWKDAKRTTSVIVETPFN
jgi:hypothetical protein